VRRQLGTTWVCRAGAVVIATGGCAFLSRLLGCHTNTGDGYLMGVEAGAELSGMEFSNSYTTAPANSTMTRSMSAWTSAAAGATYASWSVRPTCSTRFLIGRQ
jgi:succinate dehydrogenase/fumarate reductase flavoprotein subunit